MKTWFLAILYVALVAGLWSCTALKEGGTKTNGQDVKTCYLDGVNELAGRHWLQAEIAFRNALQLNENFAPAWEGLARVAIGRNNYQAARDYVDRAVQLNREWLPGRLTRAEIYVQQDAWDFAREDLEWVDRVLPQSANAAFKIKLNLLLGQVYQNMDEYDKALSRFRTVIKLEPANGPARQGISQIRTFQKLVAGQSDEAVRIAAKKQITRADAAVLLMENFYPDVAGTTSPSVGPVAGDVAPDYFARKYIDQAVKMGVIELLPDGTFRPANAIIRAEMAVIVEKLLSMELQDSSITNRYFRWHSSPYIDVPAYYPVFNSIMICREYEIMDDAGPGRFGLREAISGLEAMRIVARLKSVIAGGPSSAP